MAHLTPAAHRRIADQHGVITASQLADASMHPRAVERLVQNGVLIRAVPGAYRSPSVPWTETARCVALCLARPNIVIAGPTAGRHWQLRQLPRDHRVHVIAPPHSHPCGQSWVTTYRTSALRDVDIVQLPDGRRVTSRVRTVLDLARTVPDLATRSMIEQVRLEGRHTIEDFVAAAEPWRSDRRPWLRDLMTQLAMCLPGGAAESHEETRLGAALLEAGVRGLHRQFPLELTGRPDARFDLAVPALRWAIEVDVFPTHHTQDGVAADRARDEATSAVGWTTTRLGPHAFGQQFEHEVANLVATHRRLASLR